MPSRLEFGCSKAVLRVPILPQQLAMNDDSTTRDKQVIGKESNTVSILTLLYGAKELRKNGHKILI